MCAFLDGNVVTLYVCTYVYTLSMRTANCAPDCRSICTYIHLPYISIVSFCTYITTYVHMYVCINMRMHICMYMCTYVHTCVLTYFPSFAPSAILLPVTVVEVHPKDKKSKEEKTSVLGQVAVDLAPVVMEGAQFEGSLQLLQPPTDLAPPTQGSVGVVADVALKVVKPFLAIQDAGNRYLFVAAFGWFNIHTYIHIITYVCTYRYKALYVHTVRTHLMSCHKRT